MTSLVNLSLTVIAGLATTLAASVVVSYGLQFLIRDHNLRQTLTRFRKRHQTVMHALREIEAACESILLPALEDLGRSPWSTLSTRRAVSDVGVVAVEGVRYRRRMTQRGKGGGVVIAATAVVDAARSKFNASTRLDADVEGAVALVGMPVVPSAADREIVRRRLMELDEQAVRLLERLESIQPGDMAVDVADHLDITSTSSISASSAPLTPFAPTPTSIITSSHSTITTTSSPTSTSLISAPLTSSVDFLTSLPLIIDSVSLDTATASHIHTCVESCKSRKVAAVLRLKNVLDEVDRLLDALGGDVSEGSETSVASSIGGKKERRRMVR
ncbi:hypothetical protein HDU67_000940 [Dinochytrium kinnereticum]|nr:hypothetical protein HDU67_000940 [Dinochytrium kinnereticum]